MIDQKTSLSVKKPFLKIYNDQGYEQTLQNYLFDKPKQYPAYVKSDGLKTTYTVSFGATSSPYNPRSTVEHYNNVRRAGQTGLPEYQYRNVSKEAFECYLLFLKTKSPSLLRKVK